MLNRPTFGGHIKNQPLSFIIERLQSYRSLSECQIVLLRKLQVLSSREFENLSQYLVDDIETAVRNQNLGNTNTFGRLVVFEKRGHDTRQCQSTTIQSVT